MKDKEERNSRLLAAWNEWKQICSVNGCSPQNGQLLTIEIASAFRRKLYLIAGIHDHYKEKELHEEDKDFVQLFDSSLEIMAKLPGVNKRTGKEKKQKKYKDWTWQLLENSNDPPLKIIRGRLLGSAANKSTPLTAIVREYVAENYNNGVRISPEMQVSFDEHVGDSDRNYAEIIGELCTPVDLAETDRQHLEAKVRRLFTLNDAAVLLAKSYEISFTDAVLLKFLGKGKTMGYEYFKDASLKILELFKEENFDDEIRPMAMKCILKIFFSMLAAEKSANELLCMLKDKDPEQFV